MPMPLLPRMSAGCGPSARNLASTWYARVCLLYACCSSMLMLVMPLSFTLQQHAAFPIAAPRKLAAAAAGEDACGDKEVRTGCSGIVRGANKEKGEMVGVAGGDGEPRKGS